MTNDKVRAIILYRLSGQKKEKKVTNLMGQRVKMTDRQKMVFNYIGSRRFQVRIDDSMNDTLTDLVKLAMVRVVSREPFFTTYQRI